MFSFAERPGTTRSTSKPPTFSIEYVATGVGDLGTVLGFAKAALPPTVTTPEGTLYLHNIEPSEVGTKLFYLRVTWNKDGDGATRFSFDTTGGTYNTKVSKETVGAYMDDPGADVPMHNGAIGVGKDGSVEGAEIVIPSLQVTIHKRHPLAVITAAKLKEFARHTGKVNSTPFLGFAPGEVLFLGATGSQGTDCETEVTYSFAISQNLTDQEINGITVEEKRGWDYLWTTFEDTVDTDANNEPVVRPQVIYVERVYEYFDMFAFFGFW